MYKSLCFTLQPSTHATGLWYNWWRKYLNKISESFIVFFYVDIMKGLIRIVNLKIRSKFEFSNQNCADKEP